MKSSLKLKEKITIAPKKNHVIIIGYSRIQNKNIGLEKNK
jgi:hypothetical protein